MEFNKEYKLSDLTEDPDKFKDVVKKYMENNTLDDFIEFNNDYSKLKRKN